MDFESWTKAVGVVVFSFPLATGERETCKIERCAIPLLAFSFWAWAQYLCVYLCFSFPSVPPLPHSDSFFIVPCTVPFSTLAFRPITSAYFLFFIFFTSLSLTHT